MMIRFGFIGSVISITVLTQENKPTQALVIQSQALCSKSILEQITSYKEGILLFLVLNILIKKKVYAPIVDFYGMSGTFCVLLVNA